jgi:hypothetical protein
LAMMIETVMTAGRSVGFSSLYGNMRRNLDCSLPFWHSS